MREVIKANRSLEPLPPNHYHCGVCGNHVPLPTEPVYTHPCPSCGATWFETKIPVVLTLTEDGKVKISAAKTPIKLDELAHLGQVPVP